MHVVLLRVVYPVLALLEEIRGERVETVAASVRYKKKGAVGINAVASVVRR